MEPSLGFLGIFEEPFRLVPRLKWLEKKSWKNRKRRIAVTICTSLLMVLCVMPMAGISQVPDNSFDENNVQEVQDNTNFSQDKILYEILIMEADIDKKFDFGNTPGTFNSGIMVFNDGLNIDGESFENLEELSHFMQTDPDVKVLSLPKIIAANGSTAMLTSGPLSDSPNLPAIQLKISPDLISENNYITQNIESEIVGRPAEEDLTRDLNPKINTTLIIKDGYSGLIALNTGKYASSSDRIKKNIYIFFSPHIIKKPSSGSEDTVTQNSSNEPKLISIDFDNVDIKVLVKFISEITGKNFIVDNGVTSKVTIMAPNKLTVDEAYKLFESVMKGHGYTLIPLGDGIRITSNPPILLDFVSVDPRVVNRLISEVGGVRFIIDDTVDAKIDIHTQGNMPLNEVCGLFQSILEDKGFTAIPEGDYIRITR